MSELLDKLKQDLEFAEITTAGLCPNRTMWPRAIKALIKAITELRLATQYVGNPIAPHATKCLAEIEKELNQASCG